VVESSSAPPSMPVMMAVPAMKHSASSNWSGRNRSASGRNGSESLTPPSPPMMFAVVFATSHTRPAVLAMLPSFWVRPDQRQVGRGLSITGWKRGKPRAAT
jgi:hypothetical protein